MFGLLCDIECIFQIVTYQPVAFKKGLAWCLRLLLLISVISLLISALLIIFSYLAFAQSDNPQFLSGFFYCLYFKAVAWSPFIALEYYDLLFQHIYFDVQC